MAYIKDINAIAVHRSALEFLPESVARENSLLPVRLEGRTLHVIVPDDSESLEALPNLLDKIEFVTERTVRYDTADRIQIDQAVADHYHRILSKVTNCPLELRVSCLQQWISLAPTEDENIRYCSTCSQNVFLCRTAAELDHRSREGRCVAYHEYKDEWIGLMIGPTSDESE